MVWMTDKLRMIASAGLAAYRNSMVGVQAPKVREFWARARAPQAGDLVLEISSFKCGSKWPETELGWLKEVFRDDKDHNNRVYIIEPLHEDGPETITWRNAEFIAIPHEPEGFAAEAEGGSDGN